MNHSLIIMDSFALPVQGTETRVNAANEANEYMVEYIQGSEKVRHCVLCQQAWGTNELVIAGGTIGKRCRVVPLAPGLRMLALGDRRKHTAHESTIPRPICCGRCTLSTPLYSSSRLTFATYLVID
jgi:hypothetical protein